MKKIIYRPSKKMVGVYKNAHLSKIRILDGPVRSGKSFTANDIAIKEISNLPPCNVLISGYSITSVARNVMAEWQEMLDPNQRGIFSNVKTAKDDYLRINWRGLQDKKFYIRGSGKENDFQQIQGATFGYWLGDELARHKENFTNMALSRLSLPFSKATWTLNADSPFHYFKKNILDNVKLFEKDKEGQSLYSRFEFKLTDNPSLGPEYIRMLEQTYTGLFYKRYILNLWVMAEGAIFDYYTDEPPFVIDKPPGVATSKFIGIDYGTGNPTCFLLFGVNDKLKPKAWCEREYYYSSRDSGGTQKTDAEYSKDLAKWLGKDRDLVSGIYVDPSALSLKVQLAKDGFYNVLDADNDVLNGLRTHSRMLKGGEYAVCKGCKNTRREYEGYVWDEKAQLQGIDKPLKVNDHCLPGDTLVDTVYGQIQIKNLINKTGLLYSVKNNKVISTFFYGARITQKNQQIYKVDFENGMYLCATSGHKLFFGSCWKEIQELEPGENIYVISNLLQWNKIYQRQKNWVLSFEQKNTEQTVQASSLCVRNRKRTNTTKLRNTSYRFKQGQQFSKQFDLCPFKKSSCNTCEVIDTREKSTNKRDAEIRSFKSERMAQITTRSEMAQEAREIDRKEYAFNCENMRSLQKGVSNKIESTNSISFLSSELQSCCTPTKVKISLITALNQFEDVYCLTVPETGCFSVNGGVIVANSKDPERYFLHTRYGQENYYDIDAITTM